VVLGLHAHFNTVETPFKKLVGKRAVPRGGGVGKDKRGVAVTA
jgi:hypothetical protein